MDDDPLKNAASRYFKLFILFSQRDLRFRQNQRQWHRKPDVRRFSYIRKTRKNLSFIPACQHQTQIKENLELFNIKTIFSGRHFIKETYIADSAGSGWSFHLLWVKWREREHPLYRLICRVTVMLAGSTSLTRGMGGVATGDLKAILCHCGTPKLLAEHDTSFSYALCSVLNTVKYRHTVW